MSGYLDLRKSITPANTVLAVIAISILIVSFTDLGKRLWFPQEHDTELRKVLTKPLRLEVDSSGEFDEVLLALRTFHYRAQPRSTAVYSDIFYDTPDWKLYRNGYSYRYRERRDSGGKPDFSLRLEQEPRFVMEDAKKIDIRSKLSAEMADRVRKGASAVPVPETDNPEISQRLSTVLDELDIDSETLRPQLMAELRRERFDITDKGRNWFELDREIWSFRTLDDEPGKWQFEDVVIDTRLNKRDPELIRRVVTVRRLAHMIQGVRVVDLAPHERAIAEFLTEANP